MIIIYTKLRPGDSQVDLTYDRGLMFAYGFESGTDITFEVINGSGIGEGLMSKNFDNDKYKNVMGRISQDAGEHFRIGAMGYWGKEKAAQVNQILMLMNYGWLAVMQLFLLIHWNLIFNMWKEMTAIHILAIQQSI